jgi:hypothetical protein
MSGLLRVVPRGIPWLTVASRGLLWHPVVLRLLACLLGLLWPPVVPRGLPLASASPVASRGLPWPPFVPRGIP